MEEELEKVSSRRLALLRKLIELAYTCYDKKLFYYKFIEAVSIDSLKRSNIVDIGDSTLEIPSDREFSESDIEMYCLMQQGFSPQQIAVIYNGKSINAIYIRQHRLKKKLKGTASPDILLVILFVCTVLYILMITFGIR